MVSVESRKIQDFEYETSANVTPIPSLRSLENKHMTAFRPIEVHHRSEHKMEIFDSGRIFLWMIVFAQRNILERNKRQNTQK